jgi:uncharacterized short protein YbdD (DUF466 family)
MPSLFPSMKLWVNRFWEGMREWCGDSAYERYLSFAGKPGTQQPLTRAEFYVEQTNRRYSRPNRCC